MVARQSHQSTTKGSAQKKARIIYEGRKRNFKWVIPTLLVLIIIAAAILLIPKIEFGKEEVNIGNETILVTVNGEPLYESELDKQWEAIPPQTKLSFTREQLLEELIQEKLLLQEAESLGMTAGDDEIDTFLATQLAGTNLTVEQLEGLFEAQGTNMDEMRETYRKQLTVAKLFDEQLNETLNATNEEIGAYYTENIESFFMAEQARVRHILVEISETFNESQAQERADLVLAELEADDNENFCDLVSNYSSDFGSVDNCGEYTFSKGMMVAEFEEAGFRLAVDEIEVVETTFGLHIMQKLEDIEAGYLSLEDPIKELEGEPPLQEVIRQILVEQKAKEVFDNYLAVLNEKADIVYPEPEMEAIEENNETTPESEEAIEVTEEDEVVEEIVVEEEMEGEDQPIPVEISVSQLEEEVVEEPEMGNETTPESEEEAEEEAPVDMGNETNSTEAVVY